MSVRARGPARGGCKLVVQTVQGGLVVAAILHGHADLGDVGQLARGQGRRRLVGLLRRHVLEHLEELLRFLGHPSSGPSGQKRTRDLCRPC